MDEQARAGGETAGTETAPLPNLAVRLVQVFTSPAALFDRLKARPVWIGAIVLIVVIGLVVQALIPEELFRQAMIARLGRDPSPEQLQAVEGAAGIANALRWVATVVAPPIFIAILAALLLLVYNVFLGGGASFGQLYSATAHASLIGSVGSLITLPLILARQDLQTALALHLAVPGLEAGTYAYRFLSGITLFGVWTAVVLGIAVSRIYPKVSANSAIALLITAYVVLKAAFAIAGGT